jgi:hypothetical protein
MYCTSSSRGSISFWCVTPFTVTLICFFIAPPRIQQQGNFWSQDILNGSRGTCHLRARSGNRDIWNHSPQSTQRNTEENRKDLEPQSRPVRLPFRKLRVVQGRLRNAKEGRETGHIRETECAGGLRGCKSPLLTQLRRSERV